MIEAPRPSHVTRPPGWGAPRTAGPAAPIDESGGRVASTRMDKRSDAFSPQRRLARAHDSCRPSGRPDGCSGGVARRTRAGQWNFVRSDGNVLRGVRAPASRRLPGRATPPHAPRPQDLRRDSQTHDLGVTVGLDGTTSRYFHPHGVAPGLPSFGNAAHLRGQPLPDRSDELRCRWDDPELGSSGRRVSVLSSGRRRERSAR